MEKNKTGLGKQGMCSWEKKLDSYKEYRGNIMKTPVYDFLMEYVPSDLEGTFYLPVPEYASHTFGGWYEESDFSGKEITYLDEDSSGDKTYYAKWYEHFTLTADNLDDLGNDSVTVKFEVKN